MTEETPRVWRVLQMQKSGELPFPAINVNDSVPRASSTTSTAAASRWWMLKRATDVMVAGKQALVMGYGDVGKVQPSLRGLGATVCIAEVIDLRPPGGHGGLSRGPSRGRGGGDGHLRDRYRQLQVIRGEHLVKMKDEAIVTSISHFDNEIDVASLKDYEWENIKPQVDHITLPSGNRIILLAEGRLVNLGTLPEHPSFVMSNSFTNQVLAQIELFTKGNEYGKEVYVLPSTSMKWWPVCTWIASAPSSPSSAPTRLTTSACRWKALTRSLPLLIHQSADCSAPWTTCANQRRLHGVF